MNEMLREVHFLITQLIEEEKFPAYIQMKEVLDECFKADGADPKEFIKSKLGLCIRLLMEAPPRNKVMGEKILEKLECTYKLLA
jgi:hypothetical protein